MPFPESPLQIYSRNLLEEVICQIRFPAILKITAHSPADFQDKLRARYPIFSESSLADRMPANLPKEFTDVISSLPLMGPPTNKEYKFASVDENSAVSLGQEFLAYSEKNYVRWRNFREEMELAVRAFREIYEPAFYSRIGLRYRNILNKEILDLETRPWADLINPAFLGELGDPDIRNDVQEIRTQSLVRVPEIENGFVRLRHGLFTDAEVERPSYLIDADFHVGKTELDDAFGILDIFNTVAARFFSWAVAPEVREALGPIDHY